CQADTLQRRCLGSHPCKYLGRVRSNGRGPRVSRGRKGDSKSCHRLPIRHIQRSNNIIATGRYVRTEQFPVSAPKPAFGGDRADPDDPVRIYTEVVLPWQLALNCCVRNNLISGIWNMPVFRAFLLDDHGRVSAPAIDIAETVEEAAGKFAS